MHINRKLDSQQMIWKSRANEKLIMGDMHTYGKMARVESNQWVLAYAASSEHIDLHAFIKEEEWSVFRFADDFMHRK